MVVEPFTIATSEETMRDLHSRLRQTRWPARLTGSGWDAGADPAYMQELASYWLNGFDWNAQQRLLNRFAHFRAEIDGLLIHFIHQRATSPRAPAIVITHGWPGSFFEMYKLIPLLSDSFHVVVPSIPGFGFSEHPGVPGMNPERVAHLWKKLMDGLGYPRFAVQGGDFGAAISTWLALRYSESVAGVHLNYIPGTYSPFVEGPLSPAEEAFVRDRTAWWDTEGGYSHLQATKPRTPAFALNDSPVGLAAWIAEKFVLWQDSPITRDELLTNIMLYWITGSIGTSMQFYVESKNHPLAFERGWRVQPPCAIARFPLEAPSPPREWVERGYNVQRWTEMPRGGHFPALEEPALLAEDIRLFFT